LFVLQGKEMIDRQLICLVVISIHLNDDLHQLTVGLLTTGQILLKAFTFCMELNELEVTPFRLNLLDRYLPL
jgi:hypothetical protein